MATQTAPMPVSKVCELLISRILALTPFDGFAMNVHLPHGVSCDRKIVRLFAGLLARSNTGNAVG